MTTQVRDAWVWSAIYTDDTTIREDDAPGGVGFANVDGSRVKEVVIEPIREGLATYRMPVPQGAMPVFFRRRSLAIVAEGDIVVTVDGVEYKGSLVNTVHCIGWKRSEGEAEYLFVFEDGKTLRTNDFQAV